MQDLRHKREMQAKLGSLLEQQLEQKEEAAVEEGEGPRQEVESFMADWRREEAAAAALAEQERARKQQLVAETLEANRWGLARWGRAGRELCCGR